MSDVVASACVWASVAEPSGGEDGRPATGSRRRARRGGGTARRREALAWRRARREGLSSLGGDGRRMVLLEFLSASAEDGGRARDGRTRSTTGASCADDARGGGGGGTSAVGLSSYADEGAGAGTGAGGRQGRRAASEGKADDVFQDKSCFKPRVRGFLVCPTASGKIHGLQVSGHELRSGTEAAGLCLDDDKLRGGKQREDRDPGQRRRRDSGQRTGKRR